jgi:predicted ribosomally synthesized peptide with SipW-like signal peptide
MTKLLNARILVAVAMIIFVGAVTASATGAFFSDTETSTGNTFAAGDIDLKIDNESYALDCNIAGFGACNGRLIFSTSTSWAMADLVAGTHKFFDFSDVKPGDYGEDTISIHVGSNDAWMCAAAAITEDIDNTCTEPELADDPTCVATQTDGELDDVINFAFWADDGDNVYEPVAGQSGTPETIFLGGPLSGLDDAGQIALSDSSGGPFGNNGVPGDSTVWIGKIWCAGTLTPGTLVQDGASSTSPLSGTGFTCDGALVDNAAQTDSVEGDMQFYAVQKRNNPTFTCALNYTPTIGDNDNE